MQFPFVTNGVAGLELVPLAPCTAYELLFADWHRRCRSSRTRPYVLRNLRPRSSRTCRSGSARVPFQYQRANHARSTVAAFAQR